jgi:hypothetical protein
MLHDNMMKTLGDRLNAISQDIPASTTTVTEYQDITQQNAKTRYPNIKYWTKADYSEVGKEKKHRSDILEVGKGKPLRGNARMKDGENVMMDFVELEDGTVVDGITAAGIRSHMAAIFNEMAGSNRLPETWSKIGLLDREYVFSHLYKAFPYLQLCLDHWKAKEIGSRALSTWKNTQKKRVARNEVKLEPKTEAESDLSDPLQIDPGSHKRKSVEIEEPENTPEKRIHLSLQPSSSPVVQGPPRPRPRPTALTCQPNLPTALPTPEVSPNSPPHSIPPILETPALSTPIPDLVPSKSTHVQPPVIPIGNPMYVE